MTEPRPTLTQSLRALGLLDGPQPHNVTPIQAWAALRDRGLVTGAFRVAGGRVGRWAEEVAA